MTRPTSELLTSLVGAISLLSMFEYDVADFLCVWLVFWPTLKKADDLSLAVVVCMAAWLVFRNPVFKKSNGEKFSFLTLLVYWNPFFLIWNWSLCVWVYKVPPLEYLQLHKGHSTIVHSQVCRRVHDFYDFNRWAQTF